MATEPAESALNDDPLWYQDAIIYHLHVKAFQDSNGDGVGDFQGLTSRLDYIEELGVNTIWLLPFYPSPLRDDGYDIADYRNIHPSYGTRADFKRFVREAHRRGIRVITELVINHTSDQHPWFQAARLAPPGSSKRDFYVWSDTDQKYTETRIIFTDTETSNWAWDPMAQAYYWHRFFSHQPDLNFDNPRVLDAVIRVMRQWLDMGVDGFRLDAIPYLCEREGTNNENLPETHEVIKKVRAVVDQHYRNRLLLAEANQWPEDVREYFGDGDECHMAYHFPLMPRMYMAIAQEDRHPVIEIMEQTPELPDGCQWAIFLRNHDELTLEMVTDEERDYMYQTYAADPRMRINVGIRRRLAPLMGNDLDKIQLMNSLLLSMPGSPIIYYGDEIGMGDNIYLGDRNGVRTPMQWSPDRNAGFSQADPQQLYLPPVMDPIYGYMAVNVEAQSRDTGSLLNWMKRIIAVRKGHKAFGRGTLEFLHPGNRKILAYLREYENEVVLCVTNLARSPQPVELDLSRFRGRVPLELMGPTPFPPIGDLPYLLTLPGHGFYWFRLAEEIDEPAWHVEALPPDYLPVLVVVPGGEAFSPEAVAENRRVTVQRMRSRLLHEALPAFLKTRRWYGVASDKPRRLELVRGGEWSLGKDSWLWLWVRPEAASAAASASKSSPSGRNAAKGAAAGSPSDAARTAMRKADADEADRIRPPTPRTAMQGADADDALPAYLVPLAQVWGKDGEEPVRRVISSAVARLRRHSNLGLMYDAVQDERFCWALVDAIARGEEQELAGGKLRCWGSALLPELLDKARADRSVSPPPTEGSNSALLLGGTLFLKLYRRARVGVNPELEMGRFLTERSPYENITRVLGAIDYVYEDGTTTPVALLQEAVSAQGDAWSYVADYLERFFDDCQVKPESEQWEQVEVLHALNLSMIRKLGVRTGELHAALAVPTGDPAFDPEPLAANDLRQWQEALRTALDDTLAQLDRQMPDLPDSARTNAEALLHAQNALRARISPLPRNTFHGLKTRYHGDYHLGQVLMVDNDFMIVDFEGEPLRPFSERRGKHTPLKDVAGMLRSLDYAARTALHRIGAERELGAAQAPLERFAADWLRRAERAFLTGYAEGCQDPQILDEGSSIVEWMVLEKALYELRYELEHRPEWVQFPLGALLGAVASS